MKLQRRVLVLLAVLLAPPLFAADVQDAFQRANGGLGANWTQTLAVALTISDNGVVNTTGQGDAIWAEATNNFTDDQYSELLIRALSGIQGLWVRRQTSSGGYLLIRNGANLELYAVTSSGSTPTFALLASVAATVEIGSRLRLVASGSSPVNLKVYHHDAEVINFNDSTHLHTGGQPGIVIQDSTSGFVESWAGGDGAGAGVVHPLQPFNTRVISSVTFFDFVSMYNAGETLTFRYFAPTAPAAGKPHRFLIIPPVEAATPGVTFGDGLDEVKTLGLHNTYNFTLLATDFHVDCEGGWGANHISNKLRQFESFYVLNLVPWAQANLGQSGSEKFVIVGFSKAGYAALDLLFRNPGVFHAAAAWDVPADWTFAEVSAGVAQYGTEANFEDNYRLKQSFLTARAAPFVSATRIWAPNEGATFPTHMTALRGRFDTASVLYTGSPTGAAAHTWTSGWIDDALAALDSLSLSGPETAHVILGCKRRHCP